MNFSIDPHCVDTDTIADAVFADAVVVPTVPVPISVPGKTVPTRFGSCVRIRDSDLWEILAIWAPRSQITGDLRCVIWST